MRPSTFIRPTVFAIAIARGESELQGIPVVVSRSAVELGEPADSEPFLFPCPVRAAEMVDEPVGELTLEPGREGDAATARIITRGEEPAFAEQESERLFVVGALHPLASTHGAADVRVQHHAAEALQVPDGAGRVSAAAEYDGAGEQALVHKPSRSRPPVSRSRSGPFSSCICRLKSSPTSAPFVTRPRASGLGMAARRPGRLRSMKNSRRRSRTSGRSVSSSTSRIRGRQAFRDDPEKLRVDPSEQLVDDETAPPDAPADTGRRIGPDPQAGRATSLRCAVATLDLLRVASRSVFENLIEKPVQQPEKRPGPEDRKGKDSGGSDFQPLLRLLR